MLALILGVPTLRLRADYLAIVTIAAAEIIRQTIGSVTLLKYFGGQDGLQRVQRRASRASTRSPSAIGIPGVVSLAALRLLDDDRRLDPGGPVLPDRLALMRSPWGRVLKGIREDEDAVRSLGKNVYAYKMQSLMIGGLIGGARRASCRRCALGAINPSFFATDITFFAYTVLLIGGAARVLGPVVGRGHLLVPDQLPRRVLRRRPPPAPTR